MSPQSETGNWLLYDRECPFCRNYVALQKLRQNAGPVRLISARDLTPERQIAERMGFDLDQGMVLHFNGAYFYGGACMSKLAELSDGQGMLQRFFRAVFRSRRRALLLYPYLRAGRNLTLGLLGRKRIAGTAIVDDNTGQSEVRAAAVRAPSPKQ